MSDQTLDLNRPLKRPFSVGCWHVDPTLNTLFQSTSADCKRSLEPRLMHLLCYLAANPGRVLSREQLSAELWPRVIVNENSLTRAVSELRRQLKLDDSASRFYVETIPKNGYRLIESVELLPGRLQEPNLGLEPLTPALSHPRPLAHPVFAAAACLVFAAVVALWSFPSGERHTSLLAGDTVLADRVIGSESVLPAGRFQLSAIDEAIPFAGTLQINTPVLSRDGDTIAYITHEDGRSRIILQSVQPRAKPVAIFSSTNRLYNLSWSPLGRALLFASDAPSANPALIGTGNKAANLIMLDLETLTLEVLIDNGADDDTAKTKTNLT